MLKPASRWAEGVLRILSTIILFLILSATPAAAEPISAAIAALSSWWASAGLLVKVAVGLAVNVGVGLLEQYQARKAAAKQPTGVTLQVQMGDTLPRTYLIGTRATAGSRKYIGVWGQEKRTPNAYLVDVRELSCLPSRAGPQGLQSVRIADKNVTVLWAEPDPEGRGYPVEEYRVNGRDHLWIKYLDGTQTAADPYLVEKFGQHEDRPWKATMIGRGCQAVIMTMRWSEKLFKQGLPAALFVPEPMPLYDVRKDSTAGGSGTHRWNNPLTWEPSDNLPQMMYAVARGIYYDGRWVHGGRNFAAHRLPASAWMAALNEGDRNMGEGRRQFRGGLEVTVDTPGLDVLDKMRLGCAGRLAEVGGSLKLLVGAPAAAVFAITDETVVITREQDFEPFPSISSVCNMIRATYPEPAQGWQPKDAPERSSAALLARDDGQELPIDVEFETVFDVAQVQCLMATMIEEEQRWRVHQVVLPPFARPLEPNDVISWSSERNSYSNKKFIVSRIVRLAGCLWQVIVKELDPADYDPPIILLPPVVGPTGRIPIPDQVMEGWSATKASIDDGIGTPRRPAIRVGCEPELDDVDAVHVQIRVKQTGLLVYDNSGSTPYPLPGTGGVYSWLLSGAWCVPNGTYLVRGRLVPGSRRETLWSEDIEVIVDNLLLATDDILDGAIKELKLAERAVSALKIQLEAVNAELIANGAIIASKIADGAVNMAKFAAGIRPVEVVSALPPAPHTEGRMVYLTTDNKLYRNTGSGWIASVAAADISGQVQAAQIAGLEATKLTGQISETQITDSAISAPKIAAGAVIAGKLAAGAVLAGSIAAGAVTTDKLDALAVTADKLAANSIIAGKIAAGAVSASEIAAGAIVASKLALGNFANLVPDSEFQDADAWSLFVGGTIYPTASTSWGEGARGAIYTNSFTGDGSTTFFNIARSTLRAPVVGGRQYLLRTSMRRVSAGTGVGRMVLYFYDIAGTVVGSAATPAITTTSSVPQDASAAVTAPAGAVEAQVAFQFRAGATSGVIFRSGYFGEMNAGELIVDGTVYAEKIATNAVTTAKIAAGAITAVELGAGAVTAVKIAANAVTADKINVANLAAISASFGNANFTGYAQSSNGKMKLDFSAGTIEIFS
jgi:hypothetical protein